MQLSHECHVVRYRRRREHIERALRLDHIVAHPRQVAVQKIALALILARVHAHRLQRANYVLHQRRRVHEPQYAIAEHQPVRQLSLVRVVRMRRDIAYALAGQRQILGVRSRHDAAYVMVKDVRILQPVKQQLAIGFVADQKDFAAQRRLFFADDRADLVQRGSAVQHAGGVVRRIDKHGASAVVYRVPQRVHIRQEILVGRHHAAGRAVIVGVEVILHKERREDNHLVARIQQRPHHHIKRAARAAGHNHVLRAKAQPGFALQLRRHRRARLGVARVGHIAVHPRLRLVRDAPQLGEELIRRLHNRIAQRQVKHILVAVQPLERDPLLEHLAYPGSLLHKIAYLLRNCHRRRLSDESRGLPMRHCRAARDFHAYARRCQMRLSAARQLVA